MTNTATASTQILQRVSTLPPLPAAVGRLLRLVNAPEVEFKEIARTISLDQTLTAQLLRLANSAFYGFPQQIRTVQQATVVLGRHSIRNMALSLAIVRLRNHMRADGPLDPEEFWRHSIAVACGARMLARHQRSVEPDEAFVAGLLHDIGKIVLVEYDTQTYEELLAIAGDGIAPLDELERETFGIDHAAVGEALCAYWNIPDELSATVAAHHGMDGSGDAPAQQIVDVVNLADSLAKISAIGRSGNPHVAATWFTGSDAFRDLPERVRNTLESLPGEVASNEELFFEDAVRGDIANRYVGRQKTVRVAVEPFDHALLLHFALRARGFGVILSAGDVEEAEAFDFVIADESLGGAEYSALRSAEVPFCDYAMWRLEQISSERINVDKLNEWLTETLISHTAAL